MNARELAGCLDVAESTVSRLLSDDRRPSLDLMVKIKELFDWSMDSQATCLQGGSYGTTLGSFLTNLKPGLDSQASGSVE